VTVRDRAIDGKCQLKTVSTEGSPHVWVTNLWPEFPAHDVYWTVADGTECENPNKSSVAATFEKANTYVFAEPLVRDREVGGSNPLAPTTIIKEVDHSPEWSSCL